MKLSTLQLDILRALSQDKRHRNFFGRKFSADATPLQLGQAIDDLRHEDLLRMDPNGHLHITDAGKVHVVAIAPARTYASDAKPWKPPAWLIARPGAEAHKKVLSLGMG